jgi:hypothetical protein
VRIPRRLRAVRPTPATVIAGIALLVAMGGTGYAAVSLPANSVGTAQLKNNAVISSKVKDHSLKKTDFAANQLPRGARGPAGLPGPVGGRGPTGPSGPSGAAASKWALIGRDGNFVAGSAGVVIAVSGTGHYYVNFGTPLNGHVVLVSPALRPGDAGPRGSVVAGICGNVTGTTSPDDTITCALNNNTNTAYVSTFATGDTVPENHAFYIAVL